MPLQFWYSICILLTILQHAIEPVLFYLTWFFSFPRLHSLYLVTVYCKYCYCCVWSPHLSTVTSHLSFTHVLPLPSSQQICFSVFISPPFQNITAEFLSSNMFRHQLIYTSLFHLEQEREKLKSATVGLLLVRGENLHTLLHIVGIKRQL